MNRTCPSLHISVFVLVKNDQSNFASESIGEYKINQCDYNLMSSRSSAQTDKFDLLGVTYIWLTLALADNGKPEMWIEFDF